MAKTEWAAQVMVRLTDEDLVALQAVQAPGEARAHTYIRLAKEAALPAEVMLRYRKPPLFPEWMTWGPLSPIAADERGQLLLKRSFDVEIQRAEG
jgi:hypothetical protein